MTVATQRSEVKSNLVYSKELVNWVAYRRFCEHLKEIIIAAERRDDAVIVEVWQFSQCKLPE